MFAQDRNYIDLIKEGDIAGAAANFIGTGIQGAQSFYLNGINAIDAAAHGEKPTFIYNMDKATYDKQVANRRGVEKTIGEKISDFNTGLGIAYSIVNEGLSDPMELFVGGFYNDLSKSLGAAKPGSINYGEAMKAGKMIPKDGLNISPDAWKENDPIIQLMNVTDDKKVKNIGDQILEDMKISPVSQLDTTTKKAGRWVTGDDLKDYMSTGKRSKVVSGKKGYLEKYGEPILRNEQEASKFILDALEGNREGIAAFGKVGDKFSEDIKQLSGGALDISGKYLELDSKHLRHMAKHLSDENFPTTLNQIYNLPDLIFGYDDILKLDQGKDQVKILLGKKINGYSVIVELVSDSRGSMFPVTMYNIDTDTYLRRFPNKISSGIQEVDVAAATPTKRLQNVPQSTATTNNIPQTAEKFNPVSDDLSMQAKTDWAKNDPIVQMMYKDVENTPGGGYNLSGGELNGKPETIQIQGLENGGEYPGSIGRGYEKRISGGSNAGRNGRFPQTVERVFELPTANRGGEKDVLRFGEIASSDFTPVHNQYINITKDYNTNLHYVLGNIDFNGEKLEIPKGKAIVIPETGDIFADIDAPANVIFHEVYHPLTKRIPEEAKRFSRAVAIGVDQNSPAFLNYEKKVIGAYGPNSDFNDVIEDLCADIFGLANTDMERARKALAPFVTDQSGLDRILDEAMRIGELGKGGASRTLKVQSALPEDFTSIGAMRTAKRPGDLIFDLEPGEHERGFSKNIRSDKNMPDELRQAFGEDPLLYEQIGNPTTLNKANDILSQHGYEGARAEFYKMMGQNIPSPETVPLAKLLARQASEAGDVAGARRILSDMADKLTQAGQFTQAAKILREADAQTVLSVLDKQLKRLNTQGRKQYKKKWRDFDLTSDELKQIRNIKPGDEQAVSAVMESVYNRIADQMPASIGEKFDAWRKMAMLLNPVTHIRNITSNAFMTALDRTSSRLSGVMQKRLPLEERTRAAVVGKEYKQLAKEVFDTNAKELLEQSSRFDELRINMPNRRIFKSALPQEIEIGGHKIYNPLSLENIRKFSYASLEAGDTPFFKLAYTDRLASYMQAKGIKDINLIPQEGFDLALRGAQEATFKDPSMISEFIAQAKKKSYLGRAVDTALPFSKTPVAIANRGVEYSPIGAIKGAVQSLFDAKTGKGAAKALDDLAKGLTGSALFGLGMLLYNSGIITAGSSSDQDKREFEKSAGISPYSIMGKFSYDWAQPFAIPIAAGAETMRYYSGDKVDTGELVDRILQSIKDGEWERLVNSTGMLLEKLPFGSAVKGGANVLLDQPLLQAAQEFAGRMGEGPMDAVLGLPKQYIEQMIPSALNRTAGFVDPTIRATKDTSSLATFINSAKAKIPGVSKDLPEKKNVWGETQTRVTNPGLRFVQQFVSPSNLNPQTASPLDKEIMRVFDETGSNAVFPPYKNKPFTFKSDGNVYEVGYRELPEYQEAFGTTAKEIGDDLTVEERYKEAEDEVKGQLLEDAYIYATYVARKETSGGKYVPSSYDAWAQKAYAANQKGIDVDEYILWRRSLPDSPKQEEYISALNKTGWTRAQKDFVFTQKYPKAKNNPYR